MDLEEFEIFVRGIVATHPNRDWLTNVSIEVMDEVPDDIKMSLYGSTSPMQETGEPVETFGMFEGRVGRRDWPNRIVLFRGPIHRACGEHVHMVPVLTEAVVEHELLHQMGLSESEVRLCDPVAMVRRKLLPAHQTQVGEEVN